MPKNKEDIKLSSNFTIGKIEMMIHKGETSKLKLADFVFERLNERYIRPSKEVPLAFKNGFSVVANCCLLIETYESFREGLNDTIGGGRQVFDSFFNRQTEFLDLKGYGKEFYECVRCGILHQGETKKGWTISRNVNKKLFNPVEMEINANKFLHGMHDVLENYRSELQAKTWDDSLWIKCRAKIAFIIDNCKP